MRAAGARRNRHHAQVPILNVDTAEGVRIRTEIAGLGSRLAACLLDLIVLFSAWLLLLLGLTVGYAVLEESGVAVISDMTMVLIGIAFGGMSVLIPAYFTVFHVLWNGQTPGKRAVNIRVVSADGAPASTMQHLMRSIFWLMDVIIAVPVPLGSILIALTPRCTRLGDLAAGTLVLCERNAGSYEEPWPGELWSERSDYVLELSLGMGKLLTDEDLVLLRDSIGRRGLPREVRKRVFGDIIQFYSKKLGLGPVEPGPRAMKELYLFMRESRTG